MATTALREALKHWRRQLGRARVVTEAHALEDAGSATYALEHRVLALLRPVDRGDVIKCVQIAARFHVPLYPVSRGRNIGYGSRAPARDACALLDLSDLNRILAVDRELGTATVQPGVTISAMASHLRTHAPELFASLPLSTSTDASVCGNALDGGIGTGPYAERFAHVFSLEVVLGTGEVIRTGLDGFAGGAHLRGSDGRVGPSLHGLFLQSNLGVVTEMTFGLFPRPLDLQSLAIALHDETEVGALIDRLRPIARARELDGPTMIYSDIARIKQFMPTYPWVAAGDRTPLPADVLAALREVCAVSPWSAFHQLHSHGAELGRARARMLRRELRGFDIRITDLAEELPTLYTPSGDGIRALYWRKREPPPRTLHPERDLCGVAWCEFLLPAIGSLTADALRLAGTLVRAYGFEPHVTVTMTSSRSISLRVLLAYDRTISDADALASACAHTLDVRLAALGALPARRRVGAMDGFPKRQLDEPVVIARLRRAIDPAKVIAPGRYESAARTPVSRAAPLGATHRAIERAHLAVITHGAPRSQDRGPLRPYFIERATLARLRNEARRLLPALVAAGREVAGDAAVRRWLGLDARLAAELADRLDRVVIGQLVAAFDADGTPWWLAVDPMPLLDEPRPRSLGRTVVLGQRGGVARASELVIAGRSLRWRGSGVDTLLVADWRRALAGRSGRILRAAIELPNLRSNAGSSLLLANLAMAGHLSRAVARPTGGSAIHVPWTRAFESPGAARFAIANRETMTLRSPAPGQATQFGREHDDAEWRRAIEGRARAAAPSYVRAHVVLASQVFPFARDSRLVFEGCHVRLGIPVIDGRLARGCTATATDARDPVDGLGWTIPVVIAPDR